MPFFYDPPPPQPTLAQNPVFEPIYQTSGSVAGSVGGFVRRNANALFLDNFARRSLSGWHTELPSAQAGAWVLDPIGNSKYVYRLHVNKSDPTLHGGKRAELALSPVSMNQEYTYKFQLYFPPDYAPDASQEIVAQWHDMPDRYMGEDWRSPAFALCTENGHLWIRGRWDPNPLTLHNKPGPGGGYYEQDLGSYNIGRWYQFALHVVWSSENDGLAEFYENGQMVFRRVGPNYYNDQQGPYMKVGIYKWEWVQQPWKSTVSERTLLVGGVEVDAGNTAP